MENKLNFLSSSIHKQIQTVLYTQNLKNLEQFFIKNTTYVFKSNKKRTDTFIRNNIIFLK